jgi:perosamine synthetase
VIELQKINWSAELNCDLVNDAVQTALKTKKLFRYQYKETTSDVTHLEKEITEYVNCKYALAVSSATNGIFLALKACGVKHDDKVLIPAFTFVAVPSAVIQAGGNPILVECNNQYVISLGDLKNKIIKLRPKFLLLSHMRGHVPDMQKVVELCKAFHVVLIEDAAHALGVKHQGKMAGTWGDIGIYSMQSYKMLNAGEGGIIVSNNEELMWQCIHMSGAYENNYKLHMIEGRGGNKYRCQLPVFNCRLNNLSAVIARPQLQMIENTIIQTNKNYMLFKEKMKEFKEITFPLSDQYLIDPTRLENLIPEGVLAGYTAMNRPVRDSIQMQIDLDEKCKISLSHLCNGQNIPISYLGGTNNANARLFWNWRFLPYAIRYEDICKQTKSVLDNVFDLRLPLHFTEKETEVVADGFAAFMRRLTNKGVALKK